MIWVDGRVVPDDALRVSVRDRTFEHGLGLFETLRTWEGRAPLLPRHLARMARSARELGLPYDPARAPDAGAVAALLDGHGSGGDALLRLTLSGGLDDATGATLWMRPAPLPPPSRPGGAVVELGTWWAADDADPLLRHKSLNYWSRRNAFERAQARGFDEVLRLAGPDGGSVLEGSRTSLFLVRGATVVTPSTTARPIVPGILRGLVLESAPALALAVVEADDLPTADLAPADEVFLTNSVRGVIPVARVETGRGDPLIWPAPGPQTRALSAHIEDALRRGGIS